VPHRHLPQLAFGERLSKLSRDPRAYQDELSKAVTNIRQFDTRGNESFAFKAFGLQLQDTSIVASANTPMAGRVSESDQLIFQFQLSGVSDFLVQGQKYALNPGSFIFLPGVERYGEASLRSLVTISMNRERFLRVWTELGEMQGCETDAPPIDRVISSSANDTAFPILDHLLMICRQIEMNLDDQKALRFLAVDDHLHRMVALSLWKATGGRGGAEGRTSKARSAKLYGIEEYIRENLHRPINLAELSRVAGVSVRSLHEIFMSQRGMTPSQRIREMRLEQARHVLLDPRDGSTVTEVCYNFGFPKPGVFAGYYKARYGERPSETLKRRR
jgi:AraC-like DNA-binding protein